MRIDIITIFPDFFEACLDFSIIGRAMRAKVVQITAHNLRDFTDDERKTVDDYPYGGGPGMVMKPEPYYRAVAAINSDKQARTVLLTPQGRPFSQSVARELAKEQQLVFLCGHYEGVDERVSLLADDEISLGDFVLTGAEPAALVMLDAVVRLVPGVLGNDESTVEESFSGLLEYPHYTRPPVYRDMAIPTVLQKGHHEEIRLWRRREALRRTLMRRPDILADFELTSEDRQLLAELDANERRGEVYNEE